MRDALAHNSLKARDVATILWAIASLNHDPALPRRVSTSPSLQHHLPSKCTAPSSELNGSPAPRREGRAVGGGRAAEATRHGSGRESGGRVSRMEERLSWLLMVQAGVLAPAFDVQQVANSLWAAASLGLLSALTPPPPAPPAPRSSHAAVAAGASSEAARQLSGVLDRLALQLFDLAEGCVHWFAARMPLLLPGCRHVCAASHVEIHLTSVLCRRRELIKAYLCIFTNTHPCGSGGAGVWWLCR